MDPFTGVVGHGSVTDLLRGEITRPSQGYLFVGPSNIGKSTIARRFAAALLCGVSGETVHEDSTEDPTVFAAASAVASAGVDEACFERVVGGRHPDLVLVEPEGRASITVDQARSVVSQASLTPLEADRKVFLFEEGGMMNDEAANALLKTLEEPSPSALFIIVAETEDQLPSTVASRCRTVVFGRVGVDEIAAGLTRLGVDEDQAGETARIAGGRPGLAVALATNEDVAEFRSLWLRVPSRLGEYPGQAFRLAAEAMTATEPLLAALKERQDDERERLGEDAPRSLRDRQTRELKRATDALHVTGLEILASYYRDVAAAQFGSPVRNSDIPVAALSSVSPRRAVANAELVLDAIDALAANQRPQLAFANLFSQLGADA
jgi:DNA polymerase-3 subunit delta'